MRDNHPSHYRQSTNYIQELSSSISPDPEDAYSPDVELCIPWFMMARTREPLGSDYEDQEIYHQDLYPSLSAGDLIYEDASRESDLWPCFTQPQLSRSNSLEDEVTRTKRERTYEGYSSLILTEEDERVLLEIAMPTHPTAHHKEATTSSHQESSPASRKRRKSSIIPTSESKKSHNAIEKKYRGNINSNFISLDQCLPVPISDQEGEIEEPRKTKSVILTRAVNHIAFLEQDKRRLIRETTALNDRLAALEKLVLQLTSK